MKVWVLEWWMYDGPSKIEVFSTPEAAKERGGIDIKEVWDMGYDGVEGHELWIDEVDDE